MKDATLFAPMMKVRHTFSSGIAAVGMTAIQANKLIRIKED